MTASMAKVCIFCVNPPREEPLSDEHVVSLSLGGSLMGYRHKIVH